MVVFLGWGSLVWNPEDLPIQGEWKCDGPKINVEFKRQSKNGRLTLVLVNEASPVNAFWAICSGGDVASAQNALRVRENCNRRDIGIWKIGDESPKHIFGIEDWAKVHDITTVIWTNLPAKFNDIAGEAPTLYEAINYLNNLKGEQRNIAEEYIRRAPAQIQTEYRKVIEEKLDWYFISND